MKLVIWGSLILSILHSILFYNSKFGISVLLFAITAIFIFIKILENKKVIKNRKAYILSVPIILLSSTYFIFNNIFFNTINILVIMLLFSIMLITAIFEKIEIIQIIEKIFLLFFGALDYLDKAIKTIINNIFKFKKIKNKEKIKENKKIKQIIIGVIISLPILIIIVSLLTSADAIFQNAFTKIYIIIRNIIFSVNIESIISIIIRLILIFIIFIYLLSLMFNLIKKSSIFNKALEKSQTKNINIDGIILNTILTILNIIYLIFTITQTIFLMEQIRNGGTNHAEYARMGFFQLMAVSAINFVIILISNLNKKEENKSVKKYTKIMNILIAIFTIVILISSMIRMSLYEQEYGYTFLRLMVYAIEITELILIIPTIAYIINKKIKIIKIYFIIITCAYIIVNYLNIDYLIAKRNIDQYLNNSKRPIDCIYLVNTLSTDAIPEMTRLLEVEDENIKKIIQQYFYKLKNNNENRKWQEFNISIENAKKEIEKIKIDEKYMY